MLLKHLDVYYTLGDVYIPPPFDLNHLLSCTNKVLQVARGIVLIAGDINNVLSTSLDRLGGAGTVTSVLQDWTESYDWHPIKLFPTWTCASLNLSL